MIHRAAWLPIAIGLALAASAPVRAATLTLCNRTGEKLSALQIDGAGLARDPKLANGQCTIWDDLAPGRYTIRSIIGEGGNAMLCNYAVAFTGPAPITLDDKSPAACLK